MKAVNANTKLVEGYLAFLQTLSVQNKMDLISKLAESVKVDLVEKRDGIVESFGAWDENEDAEELIALIRDSRVSTREIEEL